MTVYKDLCYNPAAPEMCRMDIYVPDGEVNAVYLYLHGGGITHGDKDTGRTRAMYEALASRGIATFSANYRFLPVTDHDSAPRREPLDCPENDVDFPVFLQDAALAYRFMMQEGTAYASSPRSFIGGSSAGGYMSMMLCFDRQYLDAVGYDSLADVCGYVFDAGQPTTHFHLLELKDISPLRVMVDETAPFWYLTESFDGKGNPVTGLPKLYFFTAESDMPGRVQQNALFIATLKNFGYPAEKIFDKMMMGYGHCKYLADPEYIREVGDFIISA